MTSRLTVFGLKLPTSSWSLHLGEWCQTFARGKNSGEVLCTCRVELSSCVASVSSLEAAAYQSYNNCLHIFVCSWAMLTPKKYPFGALFAFFFSLPRGGPNAFMLPEVESKKKSHKASNPEVTEDMPAAVLSNSPLPHNHTSR